MYSDIQEIRALLLQFDRSQLKDMYLKAGDWAVFMARIEGADNPMLAVEEMFEAVRLTGARAPHLGLFEPALAIGDAVAKGTVIGAIDVLGRKTKVIAGAAGTIVALHDAALVEYDDALAELEAA